MVAGCALNVMPILIDGYNLLFAANIVAEGPGPYEFEASRRALLRFLVTILTDEERRQTTVVFDGRGAPPGLPPQDDFAEMRILFSRPGKEADDLIEEILPCYSAPKTLTVVSSDHRVQRAARRRKATTLDSDVWFRQCLQRRRLPRPQSPGSASRAGADDESDAGGLSAQQVQEWLDEFGEIDLEEIRKEVNPPPRRLSQETSQPSADGIVADEDAAKQEATDRPTTGDERRVMDHSEFNPFPEGYGEELLDDEHE